MTLAPGALSFAQLAVELEQRFGKAPSCAARAPGRVNLIGEHTDYNEGFVLPVALQFEVRAVAAVRPDRKVRAWSMVFQQGAEFELDEPLAPGPSGEWANYLKAVAWALERQGYALPGVDLVVSGNVPLGSGLSSSAALEVCLATLFESALGIGIDPKEKALLCQQAENEFVGMQCGIMDQFISALGEAGHALFLDTRTLDYATVPLWESGYKLVVINTNKPRQLVDSAYNERRAQCEEAVRRLQQAGVECQALRDVTSEVLEAHKPLLPELVYRRARHVVSEDERVLEAVEVLRSGNLQRFGELMNASHESLKHDYEVSCAELDLLVELAREVPGVLGSRMTGAGFGGCTVTLVEEAHVEELLEHVEGPYQARTGLKPEAWSCTASNGAEIIDISEVL